MFYCISDIVVKFCFIIFLVVAYLLLLKFFTAYYYKCLWSNTVNLNSIVDDIISKAVIIAVIVGENKKFTEIEKYNSIIENSSSITADVMLQHNINPKEYDLISLCKVEFFKLTKLCRNNEVKNGKA